MSDLFANIVEIFSSVQGEGCYIGQKQIFVRFADCNLTCKYCDTDFASGKNYTSSQLVEEVRMLNKTSHHSISLTGGEPLLSVAFLKDFLPQIRKKFPELKIYLETNGTLPDKLREIISYVDITAMDIKLESATMQPMLFDKHKEFIQILKEAGSEFFLKVVFNQDLSDDEIELVKKLIDRDTTLILQPVTEQEITQEKLFAVQEEFLKDIKDVRIIPQMHKYLGLQ